MWDAIDRIGVDATDVSLAAPAWQLHNAVSGGINTTVADERVVVTPTGVAAAWERPLASILRVSADAGKPGGSCSHPHQNRLVIILKEPLPQQLFVSRLLFMTDDCPTSPVILYST